MKRLKRPFTLVELLCVIIVIALLAALSIKATQIAYRRADDTKTKTILELIRTANERYKVKNGYYYPNNGSARDSGYYTIPLDADFLGEAYETCRSASEAFGNTESVVDAWGSSIRYCSPGQFNKGTYDVYSLGRDKKVGYGEGSSSEQKPGFGDDITNFKNPDVK